MIPLTQGTISGEPLVYILFISHCSAFSLCFPDNSPSPPSRQTGPVKTPLMDIFTPPATQGQWLPICSLVLSHVTPFINPRETHPHSEIQSHPAILRCPSLPPGL